MWLVVSVLAVVVAGCVGDRTPESGAPPVPVGGQSAAAEPSDSSGATGGLVAASVASVGGTPPAASSAPAGPPPDEGARPTFERPEHVRALYLNAWASGSKKRLDELIALAHRTEVNAFVIDIKDASGYVSHPTDVPLAREIGATGELRIRDLRGLLRRLEAERIWPIARIVIVRDPLLGAARPALAVQHANGGVWKDEKGVVWMNIAQRGVWDYNMDLAEEVVRMGFPEIQWDYVRFPDAPRSQMASARFPGLGEGGKPEAVRAFLEYAQERIDDLDLDVEHTADVFGITTSTVDVGIGQIWERFIDRIDVALPMVYPSHYYRGSFGIQHPNSRPYEVVRRALERALERSAAVEGAGRIRPWLQDFDLGPPRYGAPEVRAQIQATYDVGIQEWVLWSPGSDYTEGALQPVDGWDEEPTIRLADRIVPVSKRFDVLKGTETQTPAVAESEAAPRAATPAADRSTTPSERPEPRLEESRPPRDADEPRAEPAGDRGQPRVLKPDSLRRWIDSVTRARDTIR